ncbi:MAG: carboxymuconolactone decarboxylase family protein [Gemmatimonadales bacterium]
MIDQDRVIAALGSDYRSANIDAADRTMLDYAVKLTVQPKEITAADVEVLRETGFDDRAIHDICAITAYYGFVNRIADGLGVELETDDAYGTWGQAPPVV